MSKVSRILGPEAPRQSKQVQEPSPRPNPRRSTVRPKSTSYKDIDPEKASLSSRRSARSGRTDASKSNMTFLFSDNPNAPSLSSKTESPPLNETTNINARQPSRQASIKTNGNTTRGNSSSHGFSSDTHEAPIEVFPSAPQRKTSKLSLSRLFSRSKRNERPPTSNAVVVESSQDEKGPRRKKSNKLRKHASKESINSTKSGNGNKQFEDGLHKAVTLPPLPPQVEKLKARDASPKRSASRLSQQTYQDARVSFEVPPSSSADSVRSVQTERTVTNVHRSDPKVRSYNQQVNGSDKRESTGSTFSISKSKHSRYAANAPFQGQSILELSDSEDENGREAIPPRTQATAAHNNTALSRAGSGNKRQKAVHQAPYDGPLAIKTSFMESASDIQPRSPVSGSPARMTNSRASWVSHTSTVKQGLQNTLHGRSSSNRESTDSRWMAVTPEEAAILAIIRRERSTEQASTAPRPQPANTQRSKPVPNRNAFAQQTTFRDDASSESGDNLMPLDFPAPPRASTTRHKMSLSDTATGRTKTTEIYVEPGNPSAWPTPSPSTDNDDTGSLPCEEDDRPAEEQDATSDLPKMPSSISTKPHQRQSRLPVAAQTQSTFLGSPGESVASSINGGPVHDKMHPTPNFSKPNSRIATPKVNREAIMARSGGKFERSVR